ncbi:hypothetical protein [Shewanella algae]|uniref:hypothetical protein n=1 Tax=Shewanella algae TaxID=38313 RepID=UPI0031F5C26C
MKVAEQDITKVYVVESLRDGDLSTGTKILDEIKRENNQVERSYQNVSDKSHLMSHLNLIAKEASENDGILLFIEVHGSMDGIDAGIDKVPWGELTDYLKSINETCAMGLVVVFSCCYGVYYFRETSITGRAPYYVMFGVDKSIYENRLLETNKILVKGMVENQPLDRMVDNCNSYLHLHDINLTCLEAGDLFVNAFHNYITNECKPENLNDKANDCYKLLQQSTQPPYMPFSDFKELYIKYILNRENNEEKYNQIRDRFLMTDIYGDLYQRFHVDFDEMYEKTNMEDKLQNVLKSYRA